MIDERSEEQAAAFDFILGQVMADICPCCGGHLNCEQTDEECGEWSHFCECGFDFTHRLVNWKDHGQPFSSQEK